MSALQDALSSLLAEDVEPDEVLDFATETLEWASVVFSNIEAEVVRVEHIRQGADSDCFQVIQGILGGTVCDAALQAHLQVHPQEPSLQTLLNGYLQGQLSREALTESAYLLPRKD